MEIFGTIIIGIGLFIVLISVQLDTIPQGMRDDKYKNLPNFLFIIAAGMMLIGVICLRINIKNESSIETNNKSIVTETQTESVANSAIKVALMQNYPEAEIFAAWYFCL